MSMRVEVHLNLGELEGRLDAIAPEALGMAMEHIRGVSAQLVPVETGRLVGSGSVEVDGEDQVSLSYTGPYARYQHERLDLRHETGQAKYLEQPMVTEAPKALEILAQQLKKGL